VASRAYVPTSQHHSPFRGTAALTRTPALPEATSVGALSALLRHRAPRPSRPPVLRLLRGPDRVAVRFPASAQRGQRVRLPSPGLISLSPCAYCPTYRSVIKSAHRELIPVLIRDQNLPREPPYPSESSSPAVWNSPPACDVHTEIGIRLGSESRLRRRPQFVETDVTELAKGRAVLSDVTLMHTRLGCLTVGSP
jgi:hypothetical protein